MNKAELKKFAVEARRDLLEKVSLKAEQYGITKDNVEFKIEENYGQLFVNGKSFSTELKQSFYTLQQRLNAVGYDQLIEEVAYTWFNRIIAIRYMEVNNYLPDRVNVLSSNTGKNEPDILLQFETMNLDVDHEQINELLQKGENEQAYRNLFVAQCNSLNKLLPFLFERIDSYTELLLPDYLLDQESIVRKIVNDLTDENFYQLEEDGSRSDNVEVLGWLYQYYMSEKKERVGGLKNNAVKKEDLPVVTQLFTPKWIVQYMVQNSLGKLYDEKYEDNQLAQHWEYYLKHEENHHLYPGFESLEDIKIMDPACGSGHILLYAFEILYDMYEEAGYPSRDIPKLILENNLYGLDIDKRAQQIANFALLMKAAEKQPRFISRLSRKGESPKLNVYEILDGDQSLSAEAIDYFAESETEKSLINELLSQFENGKQFGSLINPIEVPYKEWINRIYNLENRISDLLDESYFNELKHKLLPALTQALLLSQRYDVIVTNPPYHNKFNPVLKKFMNTNYTDYKSDLYSAFIYKTSQMTKENGYSALMTPYTWMFISSHKKLRGFLLNQSNLSSLVQLEYSAFEDATVPICTFVIQNHQYNTSGEYIRLSNFKGAENQPKKLKEATRSDNVEYRFNISPSSLIEIPGAPLAYWANEKVIEHFKTLPKLKEHFESAGRVKTHNNDKYVRFFWEVSNIQKKWVPFSNAGGFKKYYGIDIYSVDWSEEARKYYESKGGLNNPKYWNREGITWNMITSAKNGFNLKNKEAQYSSGSPTIMSKDSDFEIYPVIAFLNSKIGQMLMKMVNPTLNTTVGDILNLPYKVENTTAEIVKENITYTKDNWDSYETSRDFKLHPLFKFIEKQQGLLSGAFIKWEKEEKDLHTKLKDNEEKINSFLIGLYEMQGELTPEIEDDEVTILRVERNTASKSFLSYFIGCMMGRYSLDVEGIVFAGGNYDMRNYSTFKPIKDGLIHFTEDYYFDNDIIARLREFLSIAFNPDTVNENMLWLAESLAMKNNETPEERLRRYFLDEFFNDHCRVYQKRPIYWLVDSGKQKGLRTLIYMHRHQPDTMATIRFEHLQEIQSKYQSEIDMIDTRLANPSLSPADKRNLEKSKTAYQKKIEELQEFDKKLATYANEQIDIDLDDGVKVNYAKLNEVLAKIK
ncbi:BREX-1 system adenine-specific DNA-methyltransferase PglX [Oceanobacillus sp. FSL W8-0428]|uniref:BREX-1 system adenine-specific DNA-methyltransferase PglX n=1 Tax=Oceanobacillus sp. FSL W8-0428 TaxID=2921715 RepID=UPI0030F997AC